MRYVTASLGVVLVIFALLQIGQPDGLFWGAVYGSGAVLAFLTLKQRMSLMLARILAVLSSLAMFWFFAGFFRMAPHLHPAWYERAAALDAIGLLFAGFTMITVLSEYSCRMKMDRSVHPDTDPDPAIESHSRNSTTSSSGPSHSSGSGSSGAPSLSTPATAPRYRP